MVLARGKNSVPARVGRPSKIGLWKLAAIAFGTGRSLASTTVIGPPRELLRLRTFVDIGGIHPTAGCRRPRRRLVRQPCLALRQLLTSPSHRRRAPVRSQERVYSPLRASADIEASGALAGSAGAGCRWTMEGASGTGAESVVKAAWAAGAAGRAETGGRGSSIGAARGEQEAE